MPVLRKCSGFKQIVLVVTVPRALGGRQHAAPLLLLSCWIFCRIFFGFLFYLRKQWRSFLFLFCFPPFTIQALTLFGCAAFNWMTVGAMSLSAERLLSVAAMLPAACATSITAAGCIRASLLVFSPHFHFLLLAEFLSVSMTRWRVFGVESGLDHLKYYLSDRSAPSSPVWFSFNVHVHSCVWHSQARAGAKKFRKVTLTVSPKGIVITDMETADLVENVSIYR